MLSHLHVQKAIQKFLQSHGYNTVGWPADPLVAKHPTDGDLEIYYFGENFTLDMIRDASYDNRSRREAVRRERDMLSEEAAHVCVAKAVLQAITRRSTVQNGARIGLGFPDTHNFMHHLEKIVKRLNDDGIEIFFITSTLDVVAIGKYWH